MTNWFSRFEVEGHVTYQDGLYSVREIELKRSKGVFFSCFPHVFLDTSYLLDHTCLKIDKFLRLKEQHQFYETFKDKACDIIYCNADTGHVLLDPPLKYPIMEWLNLMNEKFIEDQGDDASIAEWWVFVGVKIKRIGRFLVECLISMCGEKRTHGDLANGINILNEDATEIKLYNCSAPQPKRSGFDHSIDLKAVVMILISLATRGKKTNLTELEKVNGVPAWFIKFIINMNACKKIQGDIWGLEIQMLPPPLWTVRETLYFLVEFHEENVKRVSDLLGAKLLENQRDTNPFKKWKEAVRVEYGDRVDRDIYGNAFGDDFQGMFTFWRANVYHYNEIFLEDVDGEGKQNSVTFPVTAKMKAGEEIVFKKEILVMEKLESLFSFADTAYECVRLTFEEKKRFAGSRLFTKNESHDLYLDAEAYLRDYSVLGRTKIYGGYANI